MVPISMLFLYFNAFYTMPPPKSVLYWKVHYIYFLFRSDYSTSHELYMSFYWYVCASYNGVCIDMFVNIIQFNCWLYFILGIFSDISPMYGLLFHCIVVKFITVLICLWILYLCLLQYVDVLHSICFLFVL